MAYQTYITYLKIERYTNLYVSFRYRNNTVTVRNERSTRREYPGNNIMRSGRIEGLYLSLVIEPEE